MLITKSFLTNRQTNKNLTEGLSYIWTSYTLKCCLQVNASRTWSTYIRKQTDLYTILSIFDALYLICYCAFILSVWQIYILCYCLYFGELFLNLQIALFFMLTMTVQCFVRVLGADTFHSRHTPKGTLPCRGMRGSASQIESNTLPLNCFKLRRYHRSDPGVRFSEFALTDLTTSFNWMWNRFACGDEK